MDQKIFNSKELLDYNEKNWQDEEENNKEIFEEET